MSFKDALTPKDVEEIKPNLFIKTKVNKKGKESYRMMEPIVWNGKYRLRKQFKVGTLITFIIILGLVFAYQNDVKVYKDFYEKTLSNPMGFCNNLSINSDGRFSNITIPFIKLEVDDGKRINNSVYNNS